MLHVNPFDEPNVQQAKDATASLLARYRSDGRLPLVIDETTANGTTVAVSSAAGRQLRQRPSHAVLTLLREHDYLALLVYLAPDAGLLYALQEFRLAVRKLTRVATMIGYGPRYLHSTGQLYKGGPDTGVFLSITATPHRDLDIPGEPFSFATLELAQALGDFASLDAAGRRALHAHLPSPDVRHVRDLTGALLDPLT